MTELDIQIGKRLQQARKALGFRSARSFARQHGIPESTYSQHETGKRSLNPTTMVGYCERLSIHPGWLVTGKEAAINDLSQLRAILQNELRQYVKPDMHNQIDGIISVCLNQFRKLNEADAAAIATEKTV